MPDQPTARDQKATDDGSLSRRERERRQRRQAMLHAAQAVFAEKGYAKATVEEIAERAEFGKGTLYNYFEGGKENILFAVGQDIHNSIMERMHQFARRADAHSLREAFRRFVQEMFDFFTEREGLFMMLLKEGPEFDFEQDENRVAHFNAQRKHLVDTVQSVLERAAAAGEIRDLPMRPVAHMMLENVKGMLKARALMAYVTRRTSAPGTSGEGSAPACGTCESALLQHSDEAADLLTTLLFDGLKAA